MTERNRSMTLQIFRRGMNMLVKLGEMDLKLEIDENDSLQ